MTHHVLVTGASGYVGHALAQALCAQLAAGMLASLTLVDQQPGDDVDALRQDLPAPVRARLHQVVGDLREADTLARALAQSPTRVFHLAGITSRLAEDDFALGLAVNVDAS
ncbi:MAG: NAD-dependent epimerase/dehydratase family protein, partial [Rhodoferax sp.]|nr:NAD-dependent epimerase/dehydratase family protein [Rhodoferax sp.]